MKQTISILTVWIVFFASIAFLFYFSSIENLEADYSYSITLELITYFLGFGFSAVLLFRALVYTLRFSVDRLSLANNKKEKMEDAEFRLIIETLLIFLTISLSTNIILANHSLLEKTTGRNSDIYAILVNILGVSVFSFISFVWPLLEREK